MARSPRSDAKPARTKASRQKGHTGRTSAAQAADPVEVGMGAPGKAWRAPEGLRAKTATQADYMHAITTNQLIFGTGPAGCGKTYIPAAMVAEALRCKQVEKVILTRPVVEAGESVGFLPGTLEEKYEPYLRPFRDVFNHRLGRGFLEYAIKAGTIEALPLGFMRGMTFSEGTWVILDEAQNVTPVQMKMFLTRIGEGCKVVVTGDPTQRDIAGPSGLTDAIERMAGLGNSAHIAFSRHDVVRSGMVREILERYEST